MGVSSDTTDLSLVVSGGAAFSQRLVELKTAKELFDKSLEDLNLGKAARAAHDEAGRVLSEAKARRDAEMKALDAELTEARTGLSIWVNDTKAAIMADYNETKAKLAAADNEHAAAVAAHDMAAKVLVDAKAQVASLVKDAQLASATVIDSAKTEAGTITARAKKMEEAARAVLVEAEASKAKYEDAIARIKGAMV